MRKLTFGILIAMYAALGGILILAAAAKLSDTASRAQQLRDAADAGCIVDGKMLPRDAYGDDC